MNFIYLLKRICLFSLLCNPVIMHADNFSAYETIAAGVLTVISTICPPAAPIIAVAGGFLASIGIYSIYKSKNNKQDIQNNLIFGGEPDPEDDQGRDLFEVIKLKADKKMRSQRFGNFYRDPESKLWWSKDRAGHGGSVFKVFKEQAKGLEWIFDADAIGNPIITKHKGPVGLFISYKDLIICS